MQINGLDVSPAGGGASPVSAPPVLRQAQTPAPVSQPAVEEPSAQEVRAAASKANQALESLSATIEFAVDPDTRITVVKLIDSSDQRVLRQVPSREMVEIARALDRVQSLLIHAVA